MTPIEVHDLSVSYRHRPVLWGVDYEVEAGAITGIVGPNGAGKSTLLKAIMGLLPLSSGYVKIFGEPLEEKQGLLSYVPQREEIDWDFPITVLDVVSMSRYARLPFYKRMSRGDKEIVEQALEKVGMVELRKRQIGELSGGQQQRVFLARALASETKIYLLDEPFSGVDAKTEEAMLELFKELTADGYTIVCVHHDLNTVKRYFDKVLLLNVRLVASGNCEDVLTPELITKAYGGKLSALSEVAEKLRKSEFEKRES